MAIKARETITIIKERDVNATWRFYRIASSSSTPSQPTEAQGKAYVNNQTVPSGWDISEPSYDGTSTNSLYTCDLTSFTDGEVSWSTVSKSSSYEAAKQAYNEAQNAKRVATNFMSADSTGIMVYDGSSGTQTPASPSSNTRNVFIDQDSVEIRKGSTVLGSFGADGIRLGVDDAVFISPQTASRVIYDKEELGDFQAPGTVDLSGSRVFNAAKDGKTFNFGWRLTGGANETFFRKGESSSRQIYYWHADYDGDSTVELWYEGTWSGTVSVYIGISERKQGGVLSFGQRSGNDGVFSSSFGEGLIASGDDQLVLGKYNCEDQQKAFIIGNGSGSESSVNRSNAFTIDWAGNPIGQGMAGMVQMFAGSSAPAGWLFCRGQAVSRTTYAALFSVIGTTYGAGDGSTTFNLPDMRDRFPVGSGSTYALNAKGGAASVTLTTNTIPAHTHGKSGAISSGITSSGAHTHTFKTQADYAAKGTKKGIYSESDGTWTGTSVMTSTGAHTHNLPAHEHTSVGGGQAHENRPPYIGINFIICTGRTDEERI